MSNQQPTYRHTHLTPNILLAAGLLLLMAGCGGGGGSDGDAQSTSQTTKIMVDTSTGLVTGSITVSGFSATVAHIHRGATGVEGPPIVTLEQNTGDSNTWDVPEGTLLASDDIDNYLAGTLYFQSHSTANPGGEVRTQITPDLLTNNINVDGGTGAVTGSVTVSGFTPTIAHIHTGFLGESGPPLITLAQDGTNSNQFNVPASTNLAGGDLTAYQNGGLYVNVHSIDFLGGEIRTQLVPPNVQVIGVPITGAQIAPAAITDGGTAAGYLTLNETDSTATIIIHPFTSNSVAAAHLHVGFAGENSPDLAVTLTGPNSDGSWSASAATLIAPDFQALVEGGTYLNVHTDVYSGGEMRGQVVPDAISVVFTTLTDDEAGTVSSGTARGYTTVDTTSGDLIAVLDIAGITPTMAHIHNPAGIIVDMGDCSSGHCKVTDTFTTGELTEFTAGDLYYNVHTAAYPGGELRGQILP